jgi:hypothetical protein
MLKKSALFLLLFSSFAIASLTEKVEKLEGEMKEISTQNVVGSFGLKMITAQPQEGLDWYTTGELLYWDAKIGGTEYAFSTGEDNNLPNPPIRGRVKGNSLGWEIGGRVGVGRVISHDQWDLYLNFTYYQNHNGSSCSKSPPAYIVSQVGFFGGAFEKAKSTVDLTYLNLDLELGRKYFMSRLFAVRPYISLKAMRIFQEQKVKLNFSELELSGQSIGEFYRVYNRCNLDGIGPRIGIQGSLFIGHGFQLEGALAGAVLYSYFDGVEKEKSSPNASSVNVNIRLKGKTKHFVPFAQIFLGMSWSDFLPKKKGYITLQMGYEILYFWRENQALSPNNWDFTNAGSSTRLDFERFGEDLSFYGITSKVRLDF